MFSDLMIVTVNWNLKQDTLDCIRSLIKSGASPSQFVIIDNGSTDGSVGAINSLYNNAVNIIELKENLGYAAGANLGIKNALDKNFEWILLINNDTIVADDFIEEMKSAAITHNEVGIFGPMILDYYNPSTIWSLGDRFIGNSLLTVHYHKGRKIEQKLPWVVPIDVVNGCAMMIHRSVIDKIGLLDASLFMYGEEVDFCWRARLAGFKLASNTKAHLWHKISKSSWLDQSYTNYLRVKNQIVLYKRYARTPQLIFLFIYSLLRTLGICLVSLLLRHDKNIRPTLQGWREGWFDHHTVPNK